MIQDLPNGPPKTLMKMLLQLVLRHEFSLQMLEADRSFCLYLTTKNSSLLPQLFRTSMAWKESFESGQCEAPLRTALMGTMMLELKARLQKTSEDQLKQLCQSAGWLTPDLQWKFLAWNPKDQKLLPTTRDPTPHYHPAVDPSGEPHAAGNEPGRVTNIAYCLLGGILHIGDRAHGSLPHNRNR